MINFFKRRNSIFYFSIFSLVGICFFVTGCNTPSTVYWGSGQGSYRVPFERIQNEQSSLREVYELLGQPDCVLVNSQGNSEWVYVGQGAGYFSRGRKFSKFIGTYKKVVFDSTERAIAIKKGIISGDNKMFTDDDEIEKGQSAKQKTIQEMQKHGFEANHWKSALGSMYCGNATLTDEENNEKEHL